MEKVYVLVVDWSYDYDMDSDVYVFDTLKAAQDAMEREFVNFGGDKNLFSEKDFCETYASYSEDGDWTRNHIAWTIYERDVLEKSVKL